MKVPTGKVFLLALLVKKASLSLEEVVTVMFPRTLSIVSLKPNVWKNHESSFICFSLSVL